MMRETLQEQIASFAAVVRAHPERGEGAAELELDELIARSGAGARAYLFVPDDNYNWLDVHPGVTWRDDSLSVDNYGVFDALRVHTGFARRPWRLKNAAEAFALVQREQEAGRTVLRELPDGKIEELIGVERERLDIALVIRDPDAEGGTRLDPVGTLREMGDEKTTLARIGDLVTILAEPHESVARRRHALLRDMLLWLPRHVACEKELAYDRDVYFSAGSRALRLFAERHVAPADEAQARFSKRWVAELAQGRRAFGALICGGGFAASTAPGAHDGVVAFGEEYVRGAEALRGASAGRDQSEALLAMADIDERFATLLRGVRLVEYGELM